MNIPVYWNLDYAISEILKLSLLSKLSIVN